MNQDQRICKGKTNERPLTWFGLMVRILFGFALFAIASHTFFPFPTGSNWTIAQKIVGSALGYLLQFSTVYAVTVAVAVLIARVPAKNRSKPLPAFLNGALIATMVIVSLLIYGGWYAFNDPARLNSIQSSIISIPETSSSSATVEPIKAFTTIQTSEGITEAELDQSGLANLEAWLVEKILQKSRNQFVEMGYNPEDFKPTVSARSVYVLAEGKKLAVIKISIDSSMRSVTIVGIKGSELHRVNCIRASNHDIPVWSGECGDEIRKTFGVSIHPHT